VKSLIASLVFGMILGGGVLMASTEAPATRTSALPEYLVARSLPQELKDLQLEGRLAEAESWIDTRLSAMNAPPNHPFVIERERLARVRRDYNQTPEQLLASIRSSIPNVTMADLDRWREEGDLQWVRIDGELFYFRKEPRNLFRFSKDAIARRDAAAKAASSTSAGDPNTVTTEEFDLHTELQRILAEMDETGTEYPGRMRIQSRHRVIVRPGVVPAGETIRCWLPYPQEYRQQSDVQFISSSHPDVQIAPNGSLHRTVYLEGPAAPDGEPTEFFIEYAYTISSYKPKLDPDAVQSLAADDLVRSKYTRSQPPHVDLTPEVRALAAEIVGDETNPLLAAQRIFHWIDANIRYCSEMEYSIFTSITDKVMTDRAGDCGIHVLIFVALCRAADIPARWQSGWSMRPGSENLHDWAEFYVAPYGWIPADPSFGLRNHDDPRVREFYAAGIDSYRMIANMDYAAGFIPPKKHWRSDNIDSQRGELEWDGGNLYYDQWTYRMESTYTPLANPAE
jgi:transglutaminase-like putative cysteine protease